MAAVTVRVIELIAVEDFLGYFRTLAIEKKGKVQADHGAIFQLVWIRFCFALAGYSRRLVLRENPFGDGCALRVRQIRVRRHSVTAVADFRGQLVNSIRLPGVALG